MNFSDILNDSQKEENKTSSPAVSASDASADSPADFPAVSVSSLPFDFTDTIKSIILSYCKQYNIDDMSKASALQWRGACQFVGMWAKQNNIFLDMEKTRAKNNPVYDPQKISDAASVWAFLCVSYKKTPLVSDFIEFVNVSRSWFYNVNGHCDLSSAGGQIIKKVSDLQAAGVASGIVDGRENPTGKIYFSKAVLGWSENGIMRQNDTDAGAACDGLPDLSAFMLTDSEK